MVVREVTVFIVIIAIAALVLTLLFTSSVSPFILVLFLVAVLLLSAFIPTVIETTQYERGIVLRLGRFQRVQQPGWTVIFPTFEKLIKVDMRIRSVDTSKQELETRDKIRIIVDAISYLKVVDPKKVVLDVKDLEGSIKQLMIAEIRNTIVKMDLEQVLENTEEIGKEVFKRFKDVEDRFGIAVIKTEVESIELPPSLVEALHKKREAVELKQKMETEASAKQVSIKILDEATSKMSEQTLAYLYLDALKRMAEGRSNKIIFPMELTKLAGLLSGKIDKGSESVEDHPLYGELAKKLLAQYKAEEIPPKTKKTFSNSKKKKK